MFVRKDRAGSSSTGHEWIADGAVVEVPDDVADLLLVIPDGGFSIADEPATATPRTKGGRKPRASE